MPESSCLLYPSCTHPCVSFVRLSHVSFQSDQLPLIRDYKSKIETELTDICDDILKIIESELIPNSTSEEGKVFYYKMKGDYHR